MPHHTKGNIINTATGLNIVNDAAANTISIDQNGDTGTAPATDGALHVENTGNTGIAFAVYSNAGAEGAAPVGYLIIDNPAFTQDLLRVQNDGTGRTMYLDSNNASLASQVVLVDDASTAAGNASVRINSNRTNSAAVSALALHQSGSASALYIIGSSTGRGAYIVTSNTANPSIELVANSVTTGSVAKFSSDSTSTGTRNLVDIINDNTAATGATPLRIQQDAVVSTNFKKIINADGVTIYKSDGTTPNGALSGTAGDLCLNGPSGQAFYCTGTTNWTGM